MYLRTKDLKTFLGLANPVNPNNIIPILQYIKLENGTLTKTNLNTYVVHKIDAPADAAVLLDEKVLSAFLKECRSEQIEIKVDGTNVWILEGKRKMKFQTAAIKDFPKLPDAEKEESVEFDADALSALGVAAKNTSSVGMSFQLDYVHITNGYVVASDRTKFYCRKVENIPDMVLSTDCCNIVSQFQNAVFYRRGRYNFFEIGNTLYGFIQADVKTPDLSPFIPKVQPTEYIDINASDLIGFCDTVMAASVSKILSCDLKGNLLSFTDTELDFDYSVELQTQGTFVPEISFLPRLFGAFFKSVGMSTIRLCDSGLNNGSLSVWDTEDDLFSGIVIGTKPE